MKKSFLAITVCLLFSILQSNDLNKLFSDYENERAVLNIPQYGLDYKVNLGNIASPDSLTLFLDFYKKYDALLSKIDRSKLSLNDKINFDHLQYITELEQKRFFLEINFKKQNEKIPEGGLYQLKNHEGWYQYYTQVYTSTRMTPEELFKFGEEEVNRVQLHINELKKKMGYENREGEFYTYLHSDKFYLSKQNIIEATYREKDAIVRKNLYKLFEDTMVPPLAISTWANATAMMPPAIYRSGENRFDYNFSESKQNIRAMDWVFNHEGIPGHHYQFSIRNKNRINKPAFVQNVFYPGNAEGWACYTEYLGKELGQYQTPEEELGKWEWDLVRSLRVVLDVGIHYYGWTKEKALAYWNKYIKGQNEIANREITRVTNWPAQALSYKVGAMKIESFKKMLHINETSIKKFHSVFLSFASEPMDVVEQNIAQVFNATK